MDRRTREQRISDFASLASTPPKITALTDAAVAEEEAWQESFDLRYKIGPVFDILRHPKTQTPLTVAIYGDWGKGKTTAMRWLHALLTEWNREGKMEDKHFLRPVWFYPWKYQEREDVWRGLIAEVILQSIKLSDPTVGKITKAAKDFGLFLGRSFLHALSAISLKGVASAHRVAYVSAEWHSRD